MTTWSTPRGAAVLLVHQERDHDAAPGQKTIRIVLLLVETFSSSLSMEKCVIVCRGLSFHLVFVGKHNL